MYPLMYVDDIIITRNDVAMVQHFVDLVTQWSSIKDLKPLAYFPGIEIFHRNKELALDWQTRRKIILDIAKGLSYRHEECRQKIIHLDIKPQNILLDESFNAKVSDFGLSKLMDRDQSQVVTTLRGTPGYLAHEWLSSAITEKVDVYSFGIVTLEILCGRRNLDHSQPEEDKHLLRLFKKKAEEDQMLDLVDKYSEDMQLHGAEAVEMMRLAAW
ncbi:G-type lectin S-receptor-like serine/threonine-protein kinase SD2-5 [Vitis vinifera]|nr:G-type lectin S-receptor-like serine/threonine-protein kinase SD2-5 [Vitis vinifera]